jgi:hypothetical protein
MQTMWRSCGTYLWSKFRHHPEFRTFIEPGHEKLLLATPAMFKAEKDSGIVGTLRHPPLDQHYFAEFPFQDEGGVKLFRKRFSFENYYLTEDAADPEVKNYFASLLAYARAHGQRAFAKCCRFGLRAGWIKRNFSAVSIYVLRNPDSMFRSYWSLGGQDSYFLSAMVLIVSKNRDCILFRDWADDLGIPYIERPTSAEEIGVAHQLLRSWDPQTLRDLFLLFWTLTLQHNAAISDLVLDMDLLASSASYRTMIETRLRELLGVELNFDDARQPNTPAAPGQPISAAGISAIQRTIAHLPGKLDFAGEHEISDVSREVLQTVIGFSTPLAQGALYNFK